MVLRFALASIVLALSSGGAAVHACTPPPPPPPPDRGETDAAYRARLVRLAAAEQAQWRLDRGRAQAAQWQASTLVFVGRVERVQTSPEPYRGAPSVLVRPVRWLKGQGSGRLVRMQYTGMTTCGPYGGGDAVRGKAGEHFVLFAGQLPGDSRPAIDSVGTRWAVEPRVVAALATPER